MKIDIIFFTFLIFLSILITIPNITYSGYNETLISCESNCNGKANCYTYGQNVTMNGVTYYCCPNGWSRSPNCSSCTVFNVFITKLSPYPFYTTQCGNEILVEIEFIYDAYGDCKDRYIIIKKPDGSLFCSVPVKPSRLIFPYRSSKDSCKNYYKVPSKSGNYEFSWEFENIIKKFALTVNCEKETECNDGKDNDNDGAVDCKDNDCFSNVYCEIKQYREGNFSKKCPIDEAEENLSCGYNSVCIYYLNNTYVFDNTNKTTSLTQLSYYYCIDKKPPYFVNIEHYPELTSYADNTYDPYPNFYYDMNGIQRQLTPDKVVIDKEYISISVQSRDEYNGKEISGVSYSSVRFDASNEPTKSQSFSVSPCPGGGNYQPPATLNAIFRNLNIGWGTANSYTQDQAGLSASNNNYKVYIFLGA
ncbi:MAG: hypothetical protein QW197_02795, partial [Candidatus Aenigmatarchaeota archaeon]